MVVQEEEEDQGGSSCWRTPTALDELRNTASATSATSATGGRARGYFAQCPGGRNMTLRICTSRTPLCRSTGIMGIRFCRDPGRVATAIFLVPGICHLVSWCFQHFNVDILS